jgi:hypothetical protein
MYDAIGVLLCIRLVNMNIFILQKRCIPALENFLNAMNLLLWPRFQSIMDMHIDSVKKTQASKLMVNKDVHPHYVTHKPF